MAVQPLNKTKIIKKKTNKIRRFQSDEFKTVKVSPLHLHVSLSEAMATLDISNDGFVLCRDLGESREVLTPASADGSAARSESPESAASSRTRPDTCSDLASESSLSETKKTLNCSS
jgi:hypothetical protein